MAGIVPLIDILFFCFFKTYHLCCKQKHIGQFSKHFTTTKKIPIIPPLLIDDKFVTDIQMKTVYGHDQKYEATEEIPMNGI